MFEEEEDRGIGSDPDSEAYFGAQKQTPNPRAMMASSGSAHLDFAPGDSDAGISPTASFEEEEDEDEPLITSPRVVNSAYDTNLPLGGHDDDDEDSLPLPESELGSVQPDATHALLSSPYKRTNQDTSNLQKTAISEARPVLGGKKDDPFTIKSGSNQVSRGSPFAWKSPNYNNNFTGVSAESGEELMSTDQSVEASDQTSHTPKQTPQEDAGKPTRVGNNTSANNAGGRDKRNVLGGYTLYIENVKDRYLGDDADTKVKKLKDSIQPNEPMDGTLEKTFWQLQQDFLAYISGTQTDMRNICDSAVELSQALKSQTEIVEQLRDQLEAAEDEKKEDHLRIKELEDQRDVDTAQWKDKLAAVLEELDMAQLLLAEQRSSPQHNKHSSTMDIDDDSKSLIMYNADELEAMEVERDRLKNQILDLTSRLNRSDLHNDLEKQEAMCKTLQKENAELNDQMEEVRNDFQRLQETHYVTLQDLEKFKEEYQKALEREEELLAHLERIRTHSTRPSIQVNQGETLADLEPLPEPVVYEELGSLKSEEKEEEEIEEETPSVLEPDTVELPDEEDEEVEELPSIVSAEVSVDADIGTVLDCDEVELEEPEEELELEPEEEPEPEIVEEPLIMTVNIMKEPEVLPPPEVVPLPVPKVMEVQTTVTEIIPTQPVSTEIQTKTEIHYHFHNHIHNHFHDHSHQHDHFHQYGLVCNTARSNEPQVITQSEMKNPDGSPMIFSMTRGDVLYSATRDSVNQSVASGKVSGTKKRVKKILRPDASAVAP